MTLGDKLAEAYQAWLTSVSSCCGQSAKHHDDEPSPRSLEKESGVYYSQPGFVTPPSYVPESRQELRPTSRKEPAPRRNLWSKGGFSVRSRFRSNSTPWHRPQISHPTNFRHLHSESFQFPERSSPVTRSRNSFRPLRLDMPADDISFVMPDDDDLPDLKPPPRAYTGGSFDSDCATLAHQRSSSSMSFHLPRRPLPDSARASPYHFNSGNTSDDSPPRIPARSRMRAYTSPNIELSVERIASAMIELDRLQAEIESVVERQSIYANSRPSTAYGGVDPLPDQDFAAALRNRMSTAVDLEPMPDVPALPASAPSFAERLSTDRPQTAPAPAATAAHVQRQQRPIEIPRRGKTFAEASAAFTLPTPPPAAARRINGRAVDIPLAPPLPLVLRPPLRKKKSFSRVSNWLFPGHEAVGNSSQQHARETSLDSVTNAPRPVTNKEGFYQCVEARTSFDSVSTVSSWTTTEERGTVPTAFGSEAEKTPVDNSPVKKTLGLRVPGQTAFGKEHRPTSVGVAF